MKKSSGWASVAKPNIFSIIKMLVIICIVANNYILYPYLSIFTDKVRVLDLPDRLWTLMEIGVGGYILGRTAEKIRGAE